MSVFDGMDLGDLRYQRKMAEGALRYLHDPNEGYEEKHKTQRGRELLGDLAEIESRIARFGG